MDPSSVLEEVVLSHVGQEPESNDTLLMTEFLCSREDPLVISCGQV